MDKIPAKQRKAAIYTRISEDRTGLRAGVTRQLEDCTALAARLGWRVVAHYDDNDISAYSGKRRPGFEDLLDAIKTGAVDGLICWHTDRLYRSMKDLERVIEIADAIPINTVTSGDLDLSTSAGRMNARILGSVARQESEHAGERRVRACVQKAGLGAWESARRPFGYTAAGEPLEPEAQAIRDAVAAVLEGTSMQAIARLWNEAGLRTTAAGRTYKQGGKKYTTAGTWRAPRVRRVLVNPRYAGLKVHQGNVVPGVTGQWTPLITVLDHDRIVAHLTDPARITTTSYERRYPGAGIYRCGVCEGPMKSGQSGSRTQGQRRHYVCRFNGCVLRNAQHLDDYVDNAVLERLSQPNAHLLIARGGDDVGVLQDQRAGWVAKLDKLVDLLDDLDTPKARRRAIEYKTKIATIDGKLARAMLVSPAAKMLASGEDLRERWERMDATLRSQVIDELAVVKVQPAKRGRGFDTDAVDVEWR